MSPTYGILITSAQRYDCVVAKQLRSRVAAQAVQNVQSFVTHCNFDASHGEARPYSVSAWTPLSGRVRS
jgi:hypothetical protein